MKRSLYVVVALLLSGLGLALFLLGPGLSSPVRSAPAAMPQVRVVHAVPDAPPVDVMVNGAPVPALAGVAFGTVTDYVSVPSGTFTVTLVAPSLSPEPVLTRTLTVTDDTDYTVAAYGTVTSTDAFPLDLLVAEDDNSVPPVGMARARFFHLIPGAPAVDVAIQGGPVLLSDVTFGEVTPYILIPADTYDLELQLEGVPMPLPVPGQTAEPNTVYSFFALGTLASPDIMKVMDAQYARVRAFHGVPDAPPVDVWVDGTMAFSDVEYKELTDYAAVMSGTYMLGIAPTGVPTPVLTASLVLTGGMDFTVAAAGTLTVTDMITPELIPYVDDNSMPPAGMAMLRVIHLVPDAPGPVGISVTDVITPLFTGVIYKEATPYKTVSADTHTLSAYLMSAPTTSIATADAFPFRPGVVYNAFVVGLATGPAPIDIVMTPPRELFLPVILKVMSP